MVSESIEELQAALQLKKKELDLVLAIDHIRDKSLNLSAMLSAIATTLTDYLRLDLCLIALLDRETGQIELKAINDRSRIPLSLDRDLAVKAAGFDEITILSASTTSQTDIEIAAVPIIMNSNERLGALLLARSQTPFGPDDLTLLQTAESMLDSAIIEGYTQHDLRQYVKELETIYRIDNIRDRGLPFDEMLTLVLEEICQAIEAEAGFTMLYDKSDQRLELRATTRHDLFHIAAHRTCIEQLANETLQRTTPLNRSDINDQLHSILCLPLALQDKIIGVLGVINHRGPKGFTSEDQRLLKAIGSQIDTAIFESLAQRHLREVLGRSVDPRIMQRLLANPDATFLKGERMVVTVLYADLRGSTKLAESIAPELLVGFINDYLEAMTIVILAEAGTLDKFVGDEVMALFGAPFPQEDHALQAIRAALKMQQAHQTVMEAWQRRGIDPAPVGIGIATGELTVGEMGGPQRTDFTVIGQAANLGARICSAAKAGEVLISQTTYEQLSNKVAVTPIRGLLFKGIDRDVVIYRVDHLVG